MDREQKWQRRWHDAHLFSAEPKPDQKKFFLTFPYPYVNGLPHVGHLFTMMRVEAFARYKRAQGFNVLFPQAWHCTGVPITAAAKRVVEGEAKQLQILRDNGVTEQELPSFKDPEHWIRYFSPRYKQDVASVGFSIDWRREFITTSLNPQYDAFIRWQFQTLRDKGRVQKGKHPVVWCPKDNAPVGDHDRVKGEGETPKEFIWIKFKLTKSDLILMVGTTRPDALLGQTHLWVDPEATYSIVQVENEKWVVGKQAIAKIEKQYSEAKEIGTITAKELIGKWVSGPAVDYDITIVPAWFIDEAIGSGIVYSALEDPVDLAEIQHIQSHPEIIKEYNLDSEVIMSLKPIPIINVPEMGEDLGQEMIEKFNITSPKQKDKLEEAKGELNRLVFRKGTMKQNCGKYAGLAVPEAQQAINKDLLAANQAVMFYELTGKVVCRCLTECTVKIVADQWFITYGDKDWKKTVHHALDNTKLYPEKVRQQFDHVIDWLNDWACTREYGIGTRLPWDEEWLIESLSDSTIYMAYYTISHRIKDVDVQYLDRAFFDYVFLGLGPVPQVPGIDSKKLREEFMYWYPVDFRNSGKDLVQNHLSFFMFIHTAIFPEEQWPKSIGVNGYVMVNGEKMSKSLGNVIPLRQLIKEFGADVTRMTILNGGEGMDDPNWESNFALALRPKLEGLLKMAHDVASGENTPTPVDAWLRAATSSIIKRATEAMELTNFRTVIQLVFFEYQQQIKWYMMRTVNKPNKKLLRSVFESQLIMLSPFIPHICEEAWEILGNYGFISQAAWPSSNEQMNAALEAEEKMVRVIGEDMQRALRKNPKPATVSLYLSADWKRKAFAAVDLHIIKTRNPSELLKAITDPELTKQGAELERLVQYLIKNGRVPSAIPTSADERRILSSAKEYFSNIAGGAQVELHEATADVPKGNNGLPGKPAIVL